MADSKGSGDVFDLQRLRELIDLMKEHDLVEIDLKQDEQHVRMSRGGMQSFAAVPAMPAPAAPAAAGSGAAPAADDPNIVTIDSPMVGTFYSKPKPESPDFIKVGDHIGPDTICCIVEAMKVFNEIPAGVSGKVVACLAQNEDSVDFGKPLFKVDTSQ